MLVFCADFLCSLRVDLGFRSGSFTQRVLRFSTKLTVQGMTRILFPWNCARARLKPAPVATARRRTLHPVRPPEHTSQHQLLNSLRLQDSANLWCLAYRFHSKSA
jgi:hypothetical protein